MDEVHVRWFTTENNSAENGVICHKGSNRLQSSILTSIQNTDSL
jgi:hypothetical protein